MDILALLASAARFAIGPILIVAPLLAYRWVLDSAAHWGAYGATRVAWAELAGLMVGVCFMVTTPLPGGGLTFESLFAVDGPWSFDALAFGDLVRDRLGLAPDYLLARLVHDDERMNLSLGLALAACVLGVQAVMGLRRGPWRKGVLAMAVDLTIAVMTSVSVLYAFLLVLWLLNRLNIWALAVAILGFQEYRYNVLGLFHRHRNIRLPRMMLPLGAPVPTARRVRAGGSGRGTGRKFGV